MEQILTTASVTSLRTQLKVLTGGPIAASAAIVGGIAYIGSWDGNEYAIDTSTGDVLWKTFLGQTFNKDCLPPTLGVTSSATIVGSTVYLGGGDAYWYALDAATGAVLWRVPTADNSTTDRGGNYNWSSPLIWGKAAYVGIANDCDKPNTPGELLRIDLATHKLTAAFHVVPGHAASQPPKDWQRGGGIWSSPVVDPKTKTVFVTTGNPTILGQPYTQAMVALDARTLEVRSHWQTPPSESVPDGDYGASPVLFTDAGGRALVAAGNKNGTIYAFRRADIEAGPVWRRTIARGGQCPTCGDGTVSSMAFDGERLYAAGGATTISGTPYDGGVRALDPATGDVIWEKGLDDPVVPALAYDNGFIVVADGPNLIILDAADGSVLVSIPTLSGTYGAPSISGGDIVIGLTDGNLWILGAP